MLKANILTEFPPGKLSLGSPSNIAASPARWSQSQAVGTLSKAELLQSTGNSVLGCSIFHSWLHAHHQETGTAVPQTRPLEANEEHTNLEGNRLELWREKRPLHWLSHRKSHLQLARNFFLTCKNPKTWLGIMAHVCNPSTLGAEAGELL